MKTSETTSRPFDPRFLFILVSRDPTHSSLFLGRFPENNDKARDKLVDGFTNFRKSYPQGLRSSSQLTLPFPDVQGSMYHVALSSDYIEQQEENENGLDVTYEDRWGATFFEQCQILFNRAMKTRRFDSLAIQSYITMLTLALILGIDFGKVHIFVCFYDFCPFYKLSKAIWKEVCDWKLTMHVIRKKHAHLKKQHFNLEII